MCEEVFPTTLLVTTLLQVSYQVQPIADLFNYPALWPGYLQRQLPAIAKAFSAYVTACPQKGCAGLHTVCFCLCDRAQTCSRVPSAAAQCFGNEGRLPVRLVLPCRNAMPPPPSNPCSYCPPPDGCVLGSYMNGGTCVSCYQASGGE